MSFAFPSFLRFARRQTTSRHHARPWPQRVSRRRRLGVCEPLEERRLLTINVLANFDAIAQTDLKPPDPIIAVGPDNMVALVNSQIALYDRDGTEIERTNLEGSLGPNSGFFDPVDDDLGAFDPWVTFDRYSQRYIVIAAEVEFGKENPNMTGGDVRGGFGADEANILIAISTSAGPDDLDVAPGDAGDDWHLFKFPGTHDFGGGLAYPDFPKVAADADSIYVTTNYVLFGPSGPSSMAAGTLVTRFDKAPMLAGIPDAPVEVEAPTNIGLSLQPVESINRAADEPQLFVSEHTANQGVFIWEMDDTNTLITRPTVMNTFIPASNVPQMGTMDLLDAQSPRMMNAVWRDDSIWTAHTVDVGGDATVRWYQIVETSGFFALVQTGDIDPGPGIHTFMPHINVDASGNMGITYTQSGPDQFADMMVTGRRAGDALGTTEPGVVVRLGESQYTPDDGEGPIVQRWGDYAGLDVDPLTDHHFWAFGEYPESTNDWGTHITAFTFGMPPDEFESNDTQATATVLGSLPKITLRDLTIHDAGDVDFFKITAQDTGKLVINAFFVDALGNIDIQVHDMDGNIIATSTSFTDDEQIIMPVVTQEMYFLEVLGVGNDVNAYELEIENLLAVFTVDNLDDAGIGSLRQAIADANASVGADTVEFQAGLAGTIALSTGELTITDELTIDGPGAALLTIDAQHNSRIFHIDATSGPVTLAGLELIGGDVLGDGGAILSETSAPLSIQSSTISGNSTTGEFTRGGGIRASGDVTVTGSTISSNSATLGSGGGIHANGHVTVTNSTISGNSATGDSGFYIGGGGILALDSVTVTGSMISSNSLTGGDGLTLGGGIGARGDVTVTDSTISGNSAISGAGGTVYGGGIFAFDGDVMITSSTISGNLATGDSADAAAHGGGIAALVGAATVTGSTISGNSVTGDLGVSSGGIFARGEATIANSTISGNSATSVEDARGGGIYSYVAVTVTGSTISGNSATGNQFGASGGGVQAVGDVTVIGSTISGNSATGIGGNAQGGGVRAFDVTVISSTISGNLATGATAEGGGIRVANGPVTIENSIVAGNQTNTGFAPDLRRGFGRLSIRYSLIGNNADTGLTEAPVGIPDMDGNLIGDPGGAGIIDPLLGLLQDNGGPTETHALLPGSPAIDAGDPSFSPIHPMPIGDQRNYIRIVDGGTGMVTVDMGAFEFASRRVGDADGDGLVNAGDYTAWANQFGDPGPGQSADFNSNGLVDAGDYTAWANNVGVGVSTSAAPAAAPLAVLVDPESNEVASSTVAIDRVHGSAELNWALYMLFDDLLDDEADE